MNHRKLTQRNLKIETRRLKIQILLLMSVIPLLAVRGLAQVTSCLKEQTESFSDILRSAEEDAQDKDQPRPLSRFSSLWTRTIEGEENLFKVFSPDKPAKKIPLEVTTADSRGPSTPQAPVLGKFAVFVNVGVGVPHGDFSTFVDPGFSLNTGLEYMFTSRFSVEGILGYQRFSTFSILGGNSNLYQVAGNAKFYLVDESSNVRPFVNGGVGLYVTNAATTHFGGNVGVGVLYEVTPRFGVQGAYNFHTFSAASGLRFSTVQGGVRFRF